VTATQALSADGSSLGPSLLPIAGMYLPAAGTATTATSRPRLPIPTPVITRYNHLALCSACVACVLWVAVFLKSQHLICVVLPPAPAKKTSTEAAEQGQNGARAAPAVTLVFSLNYRDCVVLSSRCTALSIV
jgi:hypothetical protein